MVKTKIYAGIGLIVVFGVLSMLYIHRGLGEVHADLARLGKVDAPFSMAAIEMEKNAEEYALGVLRYVTRPHPDYRAEAENDARDFSRNHAVYMRLSTGNRKRRLGRHLVAEHRKLTATGTALMDKRDQLDRAFERIVDLLEQIDVLVDDRMLPAAPEHEPARSRTRAAIANMEAEAAEIGFWLSAFERRPAALARQRVLEKIGELDDALSEYRKLPLGAEERLLGDAVQGLHAQAATGIDDLLAGEDALGELAEEFVRIQVHIDDVFDERVRSLAMKGLAEPREDADAATERVLRTLQYLIPLYALLAAAVGALLILSVVRPLRRLATGTKAIGAGDLDYRLPERGRDEFADLARQFNTMVARLRESTVSRGLLEASEQRLQQTVSDLRQEIAERQSSEREREKLQAELQRSEAMAAMGALVAGVAHEVRNPLFGISSTLDAMEANPNANGAGSRHRDVLRREVNRLNKLMTDLLEYGRPPTSEFAIGRLDTIVAEAVHNCSPAVEAAGIAIVNRVADVGLLRMNHGRLLQVFVNLIENAVQHAPAGTEVTIVAETTADEAGQRWIECRVMDSGAGFAPEDLPFVFDPFFTRRRKGTGLGLAIVQRIVDEHRGTIEPRNRPEGGAMVTLRLPTAETQ